MAPSRAEAEQSSIFWGWVVELGGIISPICLISLTHIASVYILLSITYSKHPFLPCTPLLTHDPFHEHNQIRAKKKLNTEERFRSRESCVSAFSAQWHVGRKQQLARAGRVSRHHSNVDLPWSPVSSPCLYTAVATS